MEAFTDKATGKSAGKSKFTAADAGDAFEFKPLTEGLGFHKKAEKLKKEIQLSNLGEDRAGRFVPEPPPRGMHDSSALGSLDASLDLIMDEPPRKASQSISELIASLPPSLDFLDDKEDLSVASPNPYVARTFEQPKARSAASEKKASGSTKAKRPSGFASAFSTPTSDEILPSVSAAAQNAASLFGELSGPRQSAPSAPVRPSSSIAAQSGQVSSARADSTSPVGTRVFQPLPREDFAAPPLSPPKPNVGTGVGTGAIAGSGQNAASMTLPPGPAPMAASAAPMAYADKIQGGFARAFPHAEARKRRIETPASELVAVSADLSAGVVDAVATLGFSAIFLVCVLTITQADIVALLTNTQTDVWTQLHLGLLYAVVLNLYSLSARSFFGATLGEWAFDIQLGDGVDQRKILYPVRALARSLAVTFTGFVVLPLLSMVVKRDIGKFVSGLQLYRRP